MGGPIIRLDSNRDEHRGGKGVETGPPRIFLQNLSKKCLYNNTLIVLQHHEPPTHKFGKTARSFSLDFCALDSKNEKPQQRRQQQQQRSFAQKQNKNLKSIQSWNKEEWMEENLILIVTVSHWHQTRVLQ